MTDSEALAAAESAYRAYITVIDEIGRNQGEGIENLTMVAEGSALEKNTESMEEFREEHLRLEGATQVSAVELQSYVASSDSFTAVIHACLDVRSTQLYDEFGNNVVFSDRPEEVSFEIHVGGSGRQDVKVTDSLLREGRIFCE